MDDLNNVLVAIAGVAAVICALLFPKLLPKKKTEEKEEKKKVEPKPQEPQSEILKTIQDVSQTIDSLNKDYNEKEIAVVKEKVESLVKSISENNEKKSNTFNMAHETQHILNDAINKLRQDLDSTMTNKGRVSLAELQEDSEKITDLAEKAGFQTVKTKEGWKNEDKKK